MKAYGLSTLTFENEMADEWLAHLQTECGDRRWSQGGFSQMESQENSGSIRVDAGSGRILDIVWERPRGETLRVKARRADTEFAQRVALARRALVGSRSALGLPSKHAPHLSASQVIVVDVIGR